MAVNVMGRPIDEGRRCQDTSVDPFSAGILVVRQNLTSVDVIF